MKQRLGKGLSGNVPDIGFKCLGEGFYRAKAGTRKTKYVKHALNTLLYSNIRKNKGIKGLRLTASVLGLKEEAGKSGKEKQTGITHCITI